MKKIVTKAGSRKKGKIWWRHICGEERKNGRWRTKERITKTNNWSLRSWDWHCRVNSSDLRLCREQRLTVLSWQCKYGRYHQGTAWGSQITKQFTPSFFCQETNRVAKGSVDNFVGNRSNSKEIPASKLILPVFENWCYSGWCHSTAMLIAVYLFFLCEIYIHYIN